MKTSDYKELAVWKRSMELAEKIYTLTDLLPQDERFGLLSQMRRCAVSIPSNIAEGHGRNYTREFFQFLSIARGSVSELETQMILSVRLGLLPSERVDELLKETKIINIMIIKLMKKLE